MDYLYWVTLAGASSPIPSVWLALGLTVGLAAWRQCARPHTVRRATARYLASSFAIAVLITTAGHWGAELMTGNSAAR
jgi:hypothetical protein